MNFSFPHTIRNCLGEIITFDAIHHEPDGDRVTGENFVAPGCGPIMHTHWQQDEGLTVITGLMGYQILGGEEKFLSPGESIEFKRGVAHRFWNAGDETLNCKCWVKPVNSFVFYISSVFAAQNKSRKAQPEMFDGAYLMHRYRSEYDLTDVPPFVKNFVVPMTVGIGKMMGRYKHFRNAPEPLKTLR